MTIKIEKIIGKHLTKEYISLINKNRIKEFGPDEILDFSDERNTLFFFVKSNNEIMAFGGVKPLIITYQNKKYGILGLMSGIAIEKGKGYGTILMNAMIDKTRKSGKSALGFCLRHNSKFFRNRGLIICRNLIRRFRFKDPETGLIQKDDNGDGVCYNGADNLIKKIISSRSLVYIEVPFW